MVPPLSALSLALCHETLEGGGNHKMDTSIAKRNFPSCSLRSQFTASQKLPLLFPNAKHMESATGTSKWEPSDRKKKLPLLLTSFAIHCLTKASAFVPQCKTSGNCQLLFQLTVSAQFFTGTALRYMEPSQKRDHEFSFATLTIRSLNSAHQVALRGRRIPSPARYSFASLALTSLPDSPAPRLHQYIGVRFLLTIGVYHELVNSNSITLYEHQAKSATTNLDSFATLTIRSLRLLSKFGPPSRAARTANPIPGSL